MKEILKRDRGITLVALVITIIILLILAGVSIAQLTENGIFNKSRQAEQKYENAERFENSTLKQYEDMIDGIGVYVTEPQITIEDIKYNTFTIKINNNYEEGLVLENKFFVNGELVKSGTTDSQYKVTGLQKETLYEDIYVEVLVKGRTLQSNKLIVTTPEIKITDFKTGDYVKYDSGTNGVITCRVLYPASSKYGLQIISNGSVKNVTLGSSTVSAAIESYNSAIETLNKEAEPYINELFATDARCFGSNPSNKNAESKTIASLLFAVNGYANSGCKSSDSNYTTDYNTIYGAGIHQINTEYWYASRGSGGSSGLNHYFFVRHCNGYGRPEVNGDYIVNFQKKTGNVSGNSVTKAFRPCITLKDTLKVVGGDGKQESTAYTLGY